MQAARKRPGPGRPIMCRACDAGMRNGECLSKNVVYCMSCALCGELYVGETGRPVRERFQEHFRDARTRAVKTPWGHHYKTEHQGVVTSISAFKPFHQAKIVGRESSLPSCKYLEATEIRLRQPQVNLDGGWRLSAWVLTLTRINLQQ